MTILEASEKDHHLETLKKAKNYKTRLLGISTSLVSGGRGLTKKVTNVTHPSMGAGKKVVPLAQIFLFHFFCNSFLFLYIS